MRIRQCGDAFYACVKHRTEQFTKISNVFDLKLKRDCVRMFIVCSGHSERNRGTCRHSTGEH
jgi:hypothetical protein